MSSAAPGERRDRRAQARDERRARIDRAHKRQKSSRGMVIAGSIALAILALIGVAWLAFGNKESVGRSAPMEGANHVDEGTPIAYQNQPPSSGPHFPVTAPYGVSERPIEPGYWVHNLEHGGIVVLYNCATPCPQVVDEIRQAFVNLPRSKAFNRVKLVATPYVAMSSPIAYVAWGRVQEEQSFNYDQLLRFYNTYVDKGPEQAL